MWHWKTWQDKRYLTCDLLQSAHGFFTAEFYPVEPATLVAALSPAAKPWQNKQVHGSALTRPGTQNAVAHSPEGLPMADGIVSTGSEQALFIVTADCTPALIEDQRTGQVAAVHSGWKSTALGIIPQAVQLMLAEGSRPEDLRVALGPAITGPHYQIEESIALEVGRSLWKESEASDTAVVARLRKGETPAVLPDPEPGKVRLDVRQVNVQQVLALGLAPEQLAVAPYCTYQESDTFFSYRRTRLKRNQWSAIVSRYT